MNDHLFLQLHAPTHEAYEQRIAQHLAEADVRRRLRQPGPRAQLAAALRHLADRIDHCAAALPTPHRPAR
ncbi:hypothetical protein [Deinococcus arcticus]|uniref:Uncharacterized protein n=1 Tax=Deinococcus arcticus TaxID=2136176 RepID=A0A2T3W9I3_9DEIO|nr:hypothetical protein [Deinococcus arcticus]PTA68570.1 hypothetical protein C8263_07185 [Deinococcus arcticus]